MKQADATEESNSQPDWAPFALILIDVQRSFWPSQRDAEFPDFAANVARLLAVCRAEGIEVIHLRARFAPDGSDWMARHRLRGNIPCIAGTAGVETLPCAVEMEGETILWKQTLDGFLQPALLRHLRERGKRFLLTAGLVTSTCVLLTTASAAQRGFLAAVVEDCCADQPGIHAQILSNYGFAFERTTSHQIREGYAGWSASLGRLADLGMGVIAARQVADLGYGCGLRSDGGRPTLPVTRPPPATRAGRTSGCRRRRG
ncbi:MAG: isochorismatase family cysteine hydrolase [Chloroflexia bacterium]